MPKLRSRKKRSLPPAGQGLVEYALLLALVAGVAIATLSLTGVSVRGVFEDITAALLGDLPESTPVPTEITVKVIDLEGQGIAGVRVYAFSAQGRYMRLYGRTDVAGEIHFDLDEGSYRFRANYQAHTYWSKEISWPAESRAEIETGQRPFQVLVVNGDGAGLANVRVHAFSEKGRYTSARENTGDDGLATLNLADGDFKFRVYYQARYFWSDVITSPDVDETTIKINMRPFEVKVVDSSGTGLSNVTVHVFNEKGWYAGVWGRTDAGGLLKLNLADGDFKFRVYYQARYFWSDVITSPDVTLATINTGQRPVTVRVVDSGGAPQANVRVYAFTTEERYTGASGRTGADGAVTFNLADGGYRFRANMGSSVFWSSDITSPATTSASITVQ